MLILSTDRAYGSLSQPASPGRQSTFNMRVLVFANMFGIGEQVVCVAEQLDSIFQRVPARYLGRIAIDGFRSQFFFRRANSIYRTSDIVRAIIREWDHVLDFLSRTYRNACGHVRDKLKFLGRDMDPIVRGLRDRANLAQKSDRCTDTKCYRARSQASYARFILCFTASIRPRNVKRNDYSTTCSDGCRDVPEVFRGSGRPSDDHPDAGQREERNTDEQPDCRQVCDFPRAFHDSPVFDFRAIVARPTEGS